MKNLITANLMLYAFLVLAGLSSAAGNSGKGGYGSVQDEFSVRVLKLELQKQGGIFETIYTGNEYLNTIGSEENSIAAKLAAIYPPTGVYVGYRMTIDSFKIKATLIIGNTTYYTRDETVTMKVDTWSLSTDLGDYGTVIVNMPNPSVETYEFIAPVTVTGNDDFNIAWVLQRNGDIAYECQDSPDNDTCIATIDWVKEDDVIRTFVSDKVSMVIQFPFEVGTSNGDRQNTISMLLDEEGKLLGGFCHRPFNKALGCNNMISPSILSNIVDNGRLAEFSLTFNDADNGPSGSYTITGKYECDYAVENIAHSTSGAVYVDFDLGAGDTLRTTKGVSCIDMK